MQFDYQVYFRQNCVVPTILLVFSLFIMVCVIYTLMSKCNHENFKSLLLKSLYLLLIGFFLISINVFRLARGGVYLFVEKENDAVELEGVIDDTFELSWFGYKYGVEQNNGKGEGIIINETKYYLVTYGNIKKGDNVLIRVLPKSKIILEIVPISNKN